jgi:hypothetical protein
VLSVLRIGALQDVECRRIGVGDGIPVDVDGAAVLRVQVVVVGGESIAKCAGSSDNTLPSVQYTAAVSFERPPSMSSKWPGSSLIGRSSW